MLHDTIKRKEKKSGHRKVKNYLRIEIILNNQTHKIKIDIHASHYTYIKHYPK